MPSSGRITRPCAVCLYGRDKEASSATRNLLYRKGASFMGSSSPNPNPQVMVARRPNVFERNPGKWLALAIIVPFVLSSGTNGCVLTGNMTSDFAFGMRLFSLVAFGLLLCCSLTGYVKRRSRRKREGGKRVIYMQVSPIHRLASCTARGISHG